MLLASYGYTSEGRRRAELPAGRRPRRPGGAREEADPDRRPAGGLRADRVRARRVDAARHHRDPGPVRGAGARRDRAGLVHALQRDHPAVPRPAHGDDRRRARDDHRRTSGPRSCSSSPSPSRRSYRSSREALQRQQMELQATNEELQEKAEQLERQNRDIEIKNREIEMARSSLEEKAEQLALSSKYKSEFLANMSHELRTPLNSLLILSKVLADERERQPHREAGRRRDDDPQRGLGPARADQRHPRPLQGRGREDGRARRPHGAALGARLRRALVRARSPGEKGLDFAIDLAHDAPEQIQTDEQRLQQVLKNLLSNAFKFTDERLGQADDRPRAGRRPLRGRTRWRARRASSRSR